MTLSRRSVLSYAAGSAGLIAAPSITRAQAAPINLVFSHHLPTAHIGHKAAESFTGHGFRGIASTLLHEMAFDHAHIELQLAHQERNEVSASYNHALYLNQRTAMMRQWADYLDTCTDGKVVPFKSKFA